MKKRISRSMERNAQALALRFLRAAVAALLKKQPNEQDRRNNRINGRKAYEKKAFLKRTNRTLSRRRKNNRTKSLAVGDLQQQWTQ